MKIVVMLAFALVIIASPALRATPGAFAGELLPSFAHSRTDPLEYDQSRRPLLIFESQPDQEYSCGCVPIFDQHGKGVGEIVRRYLPLPQALAVDRVGDLFVGDSIISSNIYVFRPPDWKVVRILTGPDRWADGIAVGRDGTVYVATYSNQVDVFAPNARQPTRKIFLPKSAIAGSVALDGANYLYVAYSLQNGTIQVNKYMPGSPIGQNLGLSLTGSQIGIDEHNDIVAADSDALDVFLPGHRKPIRSISAPSSSPFSLAFGRNDEFLYAIENLGPFAGSYVDIFRYADGHLIRSFPINSFGVGWSVAVSPAQD